MTKQGYKQTEVGLIPEDWKLVNVGALTNTSAGGTPSTKVPSYWGGNIPWMNSGELNFKQVYDVQNRITEEGLVNSSTKFIPKYSVLIGLAGQGKTRGTAALNHIRLCTNQSIAAIYPSKKYDSFFLYYFIDSQYHELRKLSTGDGGRGGLNLSIIKSIYIPLPPTLTEQKAIATALSDVDALITSLEQTITKKKAIKQGAMQQLLTPPHKGGKRLPGFSGEWVEKKLEEILKIVTDYTANGSFASLKENVTYYSEMNYAVLVRTTDLGKKNFEPKRFTDRTGYDFLEKTNLFGDEIIMANVGSVGKVFKVPKYNMPMTLAPNTYLLKFHDFIDNQYMYLWMKTREFVNKLMSKVGSTTLLAINKDNLRDIDIYMPVDIEEQQAIAQILSDMDAEITQLETKKEKHQAIKQGMMQELLTGKTRLI